MTRSVSIVVADPDPAIVLDASLALGLEGGTSYRVEGVCDAQRACDLLESTHPDVAILGDGLLRPSTLDIVARYADDSDLDGCRIGVLLGRADHQSVAKATLAGARSCMAKPFGAEAFRAWVTAILGSSQRVSVGPYFDMRKTRMSFVAVHAPSAEALEHVKSQLEATGTLVAVARDADAAIAFGLSPHCAAIVLVEPVDPRVARAVEDAARATRFRAPVMRMVADRWSRTVDITPEEPGMVRVPAAWDYMPEDG
jgi:CheY-like chemotaxis protein